MTKKRIIRISIILIFFSDCLAYLMSSGIVLDATQSVKVLHAALNVIALIFLLLYACSNKSLNQLSTGTRAVFLILMVLNTIAIFRGAVDAKDYYAYKNLLLSTTFSLLIPIVLIPGMMISKNILVFRLLLFSLFPLALLFVPMAVITSSGNEIFSRLVTGIWIFLLLVYYVPPRMKIFILCIAALSISTSFEYRANILRIGCSLMICVLYFVRTKISLLNLKALAVCIYLLPLIFLLLGMTGTFNVFQGFEAVDIQGSSSNGLTLNGDTRTFLYKEVFLSFQNTGELLIGRGASAQYASDWFESNRYGSEVGMLNTLMRTGLLGVLIHLCLLFTASWNAISKSKNHFTKLLGIYVAFRWCIYFIEDIPSFDLNNFLLWFAIGMCLSPHLQSLSNLELKKIISATFRIGSPNRLHVQRRA